MSQEIKINTEQCNLVYLNCSSNRPTDQFERFQQLMNCVKYFNDSNSCIDYITGIRHESIFLVISMEYTEIVPSIYHIQQIYSIYIYNDEHQSKQANEDILNCRKVRGQYDQFDKMIDQIEQDRRYLIKNILTINSFPKCNIGSADTTNKINESNIQEATFMYSQILRNIFINELYTNKDKDEMIQFFREQYHGNEAELNKINKFQSEYTSEHAIYWYTVDGFLYRTINKALRTQDILTLYHLRYFIKDLHLELKKYHSEQSINASEKRLIVYRGLGLPTDEFEKLQHDHLISFSEFLSTSRKQDLAEIYVRRDLDELESVLFEVELNYNIEASTPFADICERSQFASEEEILFSMGSVFRVKNITRTINNSWNIKLVQTSDEDEQLKSLYQWLNKAICKTNHLYTKLGSLMLFIYDYEKAEFFLKKTMQLPGFSQNIKSMGATSSIFGEIYFHQNKYEQAKELFNKTIELFEKIPQENEPSTVQRCYTGLSEIYLEQTEYVKALEFSQKSLSIILADDYMKTVDLLLATRYNNIGYIYHKLGDPEKAFSYLQKALEYTKSVPSNIPLKSRIYCNLAMTYEQCNDYSNSELFWKKGLEHHLQSMPNNTDATVHLFHAVALNLADHKKYDESIEYLKQSLIVCKNPKQELLFNYYKILATAYHHKQDFQQATEYLEKAIELAQHLPNINLEVLYTDSGNNYYRANNKAQALIAYKKALQFSEPSTSLTIHVKIFIIYTAETEPQSALDYYEQHIQSHISELDEEDYNLIYYYIGVNYFYLENEIQTIKYLKIAQDIISSSKLKGLYDTFLADILKKLGNTYFKSANWSEAIDCYKQLLNHRPTVEVYFSLGLAHMKQENFQDAIECLTKASELAASTNNSSMLEKIIPYLILADTKLKQIDST